MRIENPVPPFAEWIGPALFTWMQVCVYIALGVLFVAFVRAVLKQGLFNALPWRNESILGNGISSFISNFFVVPECKTLGPALPIPRKLCRQAVWLDIGILTLIGALLLVAEVLLAWKGEIFFNQFKGTIASEVNGFGLSIGYARFVLPACWAVFFLSILLSLKVRLAISPQRVWGLAILALQESIRKKVLIGFGVFVVVLMIGGWYLDRNSDDPARLYLGFVMPASSFMTLALVLFLSAFSLPSDMKSKTIYSIVTKPVHAAEIVLGRILGFVMLGTGLLVVMCILSYLFVNAGLSHTHTLTSQDFPNGLDDLTLEDGASWDGELRRLHGHVHPISIRQEGGELVADVGEVNGHTHEVTTMEKEGGFAFDVSTNKGTLVARVPVYSNRIKFRDRDGIDRDLGINVGDEWMYRSFITGNTQAAAIWTFNDFRERKFPRDQFEEGIPVNMTFGVFRTHKGKIEKKIVASMLVRNPETGLTVEVETFETEEFATRTILLPFEFESVKASMTQRTAILPEGTTLTPDSFDQTLEAVTKSDSEDVTFNLFEDLATDDGQVEIWIQCVEEGQYLGMAQPDLYLHAADASVILNFAKGYFGIWQCMVLITCYGVMFSTFLSGAVAMIATGGGIFIAGLFRGFLFEVASAQVLGGGPLEAIWRLLGQKNLVTDLPPSLARGVIQTGDQILRAPLMVASYVIPPMADIDYSMFVASGFAVPWNWIAVHAVQTLAYAAPVFLAGSLFLFNREVAK
jgi:hypothetical protein